MCTAGESATKQENVIASGEPSADSAPPAVAELIAAANGKKPRKRQAKLKAEEDSSAVQTITSKERLMHICDFTACRLPAEDWYVHSKAPRT